MRNLNSILIEGVLIDAPVLTVPSTADAPAKCTFSIISEPDAPSVPVVVYARLADYCSHHLFQCSSLRIVGRLAQDVEATASSGNFRLCIVAEHIEIKPASTLNRISEEAANAF